jgi:uncharacterized protein YbaP (TraB family)
MVRLRRLACLTTAIAALTGQAFALDAPICKGRDLSADPSIKPRYEAFADDLVNSEGLLWKIEKPGVAASYLYGTIHSTQPLALDLARKAAVFIDGAKSVVTELGGPFDAAAQINMSSAMLAAAVSPDADTFAGELDDVDAKRAETYLANKGYAKELAHHLKLWFLALATSLPSCEVEGESRGLPEVDDTIARIGQSKGVPVIALETVAEQVGAISATPARLAAQMLSATARAPELDDDAYVTLLALYGDKHPTRALPILDAVPGVPESDRAAERDFTKLLLVSRNEVMASRAAPYLQAGGAFIAVGALHLSGKDGLIERFRRMGYSVTRLW